MSNIEWFGGSVCFADGVQCNANANKVEKLIVFNDFQLNEIRTGDYIEASELDTEQKYNDAVAVFELFGLSRASSYKSFLDWDNLYVNKSSEVYSCSDCYGELNRKLTYPQLMAIGKLKRAMLDRVETQLTETSNTSESPNSSDWSDEHYKHFYQLTEEDIKAGQIKVDAYFVNRMWKINSWEDTGAGFHILKTLPRIANNKNSLKRELVALKKQVDILCKLHGVKKEDFE